MALVNIKLPDEFAQKLRTLESKSTEIIDKALRAGAEVCEKQVRHSLVQAVSSEHKNGELVQSLGISKADTDRDGIRNIHIGFREPRSDGKSNAMIANILEYGRRPKSIKRPTSKKLRAEEVAKEMEYGTSRIGARPFLYSAKIKSSAPAKQAMMDVLNEEVSKI